MTSPGKRLLAFALANIVWCAEGDGRRWRGHSLDVTLCLG